MATATEEVSASGVGPLAPQEEDNEDKYDPKVQFKINLEPKIEPVTPKGYRGSVYNITRAKKTISY